MRTRIAILMHSFFFINIWLLILCDTGIYAIINGSTMLTGVWVIKCKDDVCVHMMCINGGEGGGEGC